MFAGSYFGDRYFAPRYFAKAGLDGPPPPTGVHYTGGRGRFRRHIPAAAILIFCMLWDKW